MRLYSLSLASATASSIVSKGIIVITVRIDVCQFGGQTSLTYGEARTREQLTRPKRFSRPDQHLLVDVCQYSRLYQGLVVSLCFLVITSQEQICAFLHSVADLLRNVPGRAWVEERALCESEVAFSRQLCSECDGRYEKSAEC